MSERAFRRKVEWSTSSYWLESGKELEMETAFSVSLRVVCEVSDSILSSSAEVLPFSSKSLGDVSRHFPASVLSPSGTCPVTSRPLSCPRGRVPSLPGPCPVLGDVSRHFPASVLSSGTCPSLPGLCPLLRDVSRHFPAPVPSCPRGRVPSLPGPRPVLRDVSRHFPAPVLSCPRGRAQIGSAHV